jgi:hypothetical protein
VIQGAAPIVVTGNGSVQQPYVISLGINGQTGCAAITACISENLGPGLTYDSATGDILLDLSDDAGNTLTFGTDGGLKNLDGIAPTPAICTQTIADLPAAPNTVGAWALAQLRGPYSSPYQVDYCLATGCDIIHFRATTSSDDVAVVPDLNTHRIEDTRTNIYISQEARQVSAGQWAQMLNYAGDENDPVSYQIATGGDRTDRRGGWYGWLAQRYYQPLASDFLAKINGKAVAFLDIVPGAGAVYPESDGLIGTIRAVLQYCAQQWAMIGVSTVANATTVINSGITPIMTPLQPATWGTTALPYTTAALTTAGVQWLCLSDFYADSVFATYRDAGFKVLMNTNSRHSQRARVEALNIRGAMADDPVYYRGTTGAWPYGYRVETDPWEHRKIATGQLTFSTDQKAVVSAGGFVRGRAEAAEQGLILPAGFGSTLGRPAVLCGWACPLFDSLSYSITWDMKWNTLATVSTVRAKMGLLFGAVTDRDTYDWPVGDAGQNPFALPEGQKTLYRVFQRQNGEIGIAKWASQASAITYLATASTPAIAADVYNSYTLTVTPTQITFRRTTSGGTNYTVTAADAQYRGGYFWVEKEEGSNGDTANPFEGKFRNVTYTDM